MTSSVDLVDLTRVYGTVRALDGLTLQVAQGEMVALLGPSGCGKTTALRILAGLDHATSGLVQVGDRDVTTMPANKRDMGMVFQAYSLFPHLTARQNVEFGLKLRGRPAAARRTRAAEMLDLVGLSAHADKYADELSGGQQQRVALARALAIQPSVLLLDEPLSALDAKVRAQLRDEIRRLHDELGTTTLFVTHDQDEALAIADRVGVMSHGRLEQIGSPAQVYRTPATEFVADFVGLNNEVPAVVEAGRARLLGAEVPALPGSIPRGAGTALLRPEAITLHEDSNGTATEATEAIVAAVTFLGAVSRVRVALGDGSTVDAQLGAGAAHAVHVGARVRIGVEAAGVLVVPARRP